jgi:protein TonB
MLLLSASLHLAVLMLVQPMRVVQAVTPPPITARLLDPMTDAAPALAEVIALPPTDVPESLPLPVAANTEMPPAPLPPETRPAQVPTEPAKPAPAQESKPTAVETPATQLPLADATPATLPSIPMLFDPTWYTARQLDRQPRALNAIQPAYPPEAQRAGTQGSLKLMLRVNESGVVEEAVVEEADPQGVFDASALAAFGKARFAPAEKNQRPVRAQIYIRVTFRLE